MLDTIKPCVEALGERYIINIWIIMRWFVWFFPQTITMVCMLDTTKPCVEALGARYIINTWIIIISGNILKNDCII